MINAETLKKELINSNENIILLDVRSADEFTGELGHITGAINIPLDELETRITELNNHQNKHIIALCRTDRRARIAAQKLGNAGFSNITVLQNGMTGWNKLSYEISAQ